MPGLWGLMLLAWQSGFDELLPGKPKWIPERDVPDLTGKVAIVTGGNAGIGKETARVLALKNAKVYLAARDASKASAAVAEIKKAQPNARLEVLALDLADLTTVKSAAAEFNSKEDKLDMLFCNAGIMGVPIEQVSKQGYDLQWAVHILGHHYLTKLVLPALIKSGSARVVHTSSGASTGGKIDLASLDKTNNAYRIKKGTAFMYGQSKLANIIMANEMARRYADQGIVGISVNPGNINSELTRNIAFPGFVVKYVQPLMLFPVSTGATSQLFAGTAPEAKELSGKYLVPWARVKKPSPLATDAKLGASVWDWCEDAIKDL